MQRVFDEEGINWWKTPAESPDCNPIENLWHELKEFIRREIKPKNKQELIDGIHKFWETVSTEKCKKYIGHLRKVIPKIIENEGGPTGYWRFIWVAVWWQPGSMLWVIVLLNFLYHYIIIICQTFTICYTTPVRGKYFNKHFTLFNYTPWYMIYYELQR